MILFFAFMLSLLAFAYPLVIYPALVCLVAAVRPRRWEVGPIKASVVHIIVVHNAAESIREKLENTLRVIAPGSMQIVVGGDGCTDATGAIVQEFAETGVRWLDCPRKGKERTQLSAIEATDAEIIVFSDISTRLEAGMIEELLAPFADPQVGCVSGTSVLKKSESSRTGEDLFIRYEMALRRAESLAGSLVGASGCFFAARRSVALQFKEGIPSDLGGALIAIADGQRAVAQASARCFYAETPSIDKVFVRWRRTAVRGIRCLWEYRRSLSLRRPIVTWQILSHKWWRFLLPFCALVAFGLAVAATIAGQAWGQYATAGFAGIAVLAGLGYFRVPPIGRSVICRGAQFLLVINLALLAAWFCLLVLGQKEVIWTPTRRS